MMRSKVILTMPKAPDRIGFECNWAVLDKDSDKVVAVFYENHHAHRFVNDMNGRSECNYYLRYVEGAL